MYSVIGHLHIMVALIGIATTLVVGRWYDVPSFCVSGVGIFMAVTLTDIVRVRPSREERITLSGHWHILSVLIAGIILFYAADRLGLKGRVRQWFGWLVILGSDLAFAAVTVFSLKRGLGGGHPLPAHRPHDHLRRRHPGHAGRSPDDASLALGLDEAHPQDPDDEVLDAPLDRRAGKHPPNRGDERR
jgi:hypothetical protein